MEQLLQRISKPHVLRDMVYPQKDKINDSKSTEYLMNRIAMRRRLSSIQDQLIETIKYMRCDVKFIEHLATCRFCQLERQLDVERYLGNRSTWYLSLENSEYIEKMFRKCPKEKNYYIPSYWEQLKYYEKYGTLEGMANETLKFILDRAQWAYKIIGEHIHIARKMLRMVKSWEFTDEQMLKFQKLEEKLWRTGIVLNAA